MNGSFLRLAAVAIAAVFTAIASAQTFGSTQVVAGVHVGSVFHGHLGPTFVTFTPATLAGCSNSNGGYLSTGWMTPDTSKHATQIALLLAAKVADSTVEVRYRVNSQGTGWDKCTIDAIWVQ